MPRKSKKPVRKQTHSPTGEVVGQVGQILLPMIAGIAATKADLTEWVYEQGLTALHLLLKEDAEEIAGPKGKHEKGRTHNHWGSTNGELSFGGRRIQVSRPRVRSKSGEEASLPHFEAFREEDPLPERVLNQILVGVSTRNYESSLDKPAAKLKSRGTSKSAASRHLVSQTTQKLEEYLTSCRRGTKTSGWMTTASSRRMTAKLTKSSENDPSTVSRLPYPSTRGGAFGRRRGHVGAADRDPRDDSQSRAERLAAGVRVSTTGRRRESFLQVQAHAQKQPSRARLRIFNPMILMVGGTGFEPVTTWV